MLWISAAILNIPLFLTIYFNKEADFCMEYWPKPSWLPKAYTSTWVFVAGVIPVMTMTALYSRVLYSLWFKREGNNLENTQQVNVYLWLKISSSSRGKSSQHFSTNWILRWNQFPFDSREKKTMFKIKMNFEVRSLIFSCGVFWFLFCFLIVLKLDPTTRQTHIIRALQRTKSFIIMHNT